MLCGPGAECVSPATDETIASNNVVKGNTLKNNAKSGILCGSNILDDNDDDDDDDDDDNDDDDDDDDDD